MRVITLEQGKLQLQENEILGFIEKQVTPFGNSAKVDCPKKYIGKRAYLIICKE